jgi:hypothetical protein
MHSSHNRSPVIAYQREQRYDRRAVIAMAASGLSGLAGCAGGGDTPSPTPTAATPSPDFDGNRVAIPRQTPSTTPGPIDLQGPALDVGTFEPYEPEAYGDNPITSGQVWLRWDQDALYVLADIADAVHHNERSVGELWKGDALQVAIGAGGPDADAGWNEFTVADGADGPTIVRRGFRSLAADATTLSAPTVSIERSGDGRTRYVVEIGWNAFTADVGPDSSVLSLNVALINRDSADAYGGLCQWTPGLFGNKTRKQYGLATLRGDGA